MRASAALVPAIQMFVAISIAVLIFIAIEQASKGMTTKGEFIAFITATALLLPPIKRLAGANEFLQRGIAASQSVCELIDAAPELTTKLECPKISKSIVFNNVYFSFGKKRCCIISRFKLRKANFLRLWGPLGEVKAP